MRMKYDTFLCEDITIIDHISLDRGFASGISLRFYPHHEIIQFSPRHVNGIWTELIDENLIGDGNGGTGRFTSTSFHTPFFISTFLLTKEHYNY